MYLCILYGSDMLGIKLSDVQDSYYLDNQQIFRERNSGNFTCFESQF